jgi:hypothetical protein
MEISNFGQKPTPVCIWGTHGLGKTDMVKDYANKRNWDFRYIAPAQFEEMGDLHGMPYISETVEEWFVKSRPAGINGNQFWLAAESGYLYKTGESVESLWEK